MDEQTELVILVINGCTGCEAVSYRLQAAAGSMETNGKWPWQKWTKTC